jgi:hypothetical protein
MSSLEMLSYYHLGAYCLGEASHKNKPLLHVVIISSHISHKGRSLTCVATEDERNHAIHMNCNNATGQHMLPPGATLC